MQTPDLARHVLEALPLTSCTQPPSKFVAIAGNDGPRWLLPNDSGNLDGVLSQWSPYRPSSRLKWKGIRAASRLRVLSSLPSVETMEAGNLNEVDWRSVGWTGSRPPTPVVYVGTPGKTQKAVIHLLDSVTGACDAVVKVPLGEAAKAAILREANVLAALTAQGYLCAPRLLQVDDERGIVTQQFLPGTSGNRRFLPEYRDLMSYLRLHDEHTTLVEHAAAWQNELLWSVGEPEDAELMGSALAELCDAHELPAFWEHGDFTPWNIRHCTDRTPVLLDWEDAQWRSLPMQDAYHFLHMQDYLFGSAPRAHCKTLEALGRSFELTSRECHKLEVAHLARSYQRSYGRGEQRHAGFLLQSLAAVMKDRPHRCSFPSPRFGPQLVPASVKKTPGVRGQLFAALVAQLNAAEIPYCVLGGYEGDLETSTSDIDLMFRPRDLHRVPELLAQTAQSAGGVVVQSIQHESTAFYCVLAKPEDGRIGYLDPDCCSDYHRNGRTWLMADKVIAARRRHEDFYLPSAADHFTYYAIKKVLKQAVNEEQLARLKQLFVTDTPGCRQRVAQLWSGETGLLVQRAILEQDLAWFQKQLPVLLAELRGAPAVERWPDRFGHLFREGARWLRRVGNPTGVSVLIVGGGQEQRAALAKELCSNLAATFRRTQRRVLPDSFPNPLAHWIARVRSTLVVSSAEGSPAFFSLSKILRRLVTRLACGLCQPDLVFLLRSEGVDVDELIPATLLDGRDLICLNAADTQEELIRRGVRSVLGFLTARMETQLQSSRASNPGFEMARHESH